MLLILTFWTGASLSCSYDARRFHAECHAKLSLPAQIEARLSLLHPWSAARLGSTKPIKQVVCTVSFERAPFPCRVRCPGKHPE